MTCREREALLEAYVDGELELSASLELEAHLAVCRECAARAEALRLFSRTIRSHATQHLPKREFIETLRASLRPAAKRSASAAPTIARKPGLAAVFVAAAAIVLAWLGGVWWARPSYELRLSEDVVAAHIRSLQAEHLTDVASSDRHTVNPWFQGKLTFAVKAQDHVDRGFTLVGARLEYIGASNAAALVYRHGKHVLNVFEWPADTSASTEPRSSTVRGYATQHWIADGMNVWIVSDADASTLAELASLLRHEGS